MLDLNFDFDPSVNSPAQNASFRAWADEVWAANRSGPYSLASGNVGPWLPFPVISPRHQEIAASLSAQDHAALLPPGTHPTVIAGYRAQMLAMAASIRGNGTAFFNMPLSGRPTTTLIANLHALSRGTVNIDPQNPEAEPRVDYRALSNPLDGAISADILRYLRTYFKNSANAPYQPVEVTPGANLTSDDHLVAYIQQSMRPSGHHPAGTCAMMPRHLGGVVDESLKVYGVRNLRIVDASIMPVIIGANTCLPVYAVAEKVCGLDPVGDAKLMQEILRLGRRHNQGG
jgi:choline dehydrogenase